jgi:hypothetical protein
MPAVRDFRAEVTEQQQPATAENDLARLERPNPLYADERYRTRPVRALNPTHQAPFMLYQEKLSAEIEIILWTKLK